MRVIYPYTTMPEHPAIARRLADDLDWAPVLWIAPSSQSAEVGRFFPMAHFQTVEDAVYGRPIPGLNSTQPHIPDRNLWEDLQQDMPRIMGSMDYYGPPDTFLYPERERFARRLIMQWNEIVERLHPDVVFFKEAPHLPYTFTLYALCCHYGILTPFLMPTAIPTFSILKDRLDGPPLRFESTDFKSSSPSDTDGIHPEIRSAAEAMRTGESFEHWYMERQAAAEDVTEPGTAAASQLALSARAALRRIPKLSGLMRGVARRAPVGDGQTANQNQTSEWILLKFPGSPPGDPPLTLKDYAEYSEASAVRKHLLKSYYLSRCEEPDFQNDKYVYFAMHYQPERTTSADGGIFKDQYLAVAMLNEALPDDWVIYVKEHPSQFAKMLHGDKGRTTDLYEDLAKLERVRLIAPDVPSKRLTMEARAVATITGTLGWEAALNHVPAMTFGRTWYEGCPGVLGISSVEDARAAVSQIQTGIEITDAHIDDYLLRLSRAALRIDLNAWTRDGPAATLESQTEGFLSAVAWWMENRYSPSA